MTYVPTDRFHFVARSGQELEMFVEPDRGDYERDALMLAFDTIPDALRALQFTVHEMRMQGGLPSLPVRFPLRRRWEPESAGESVLSEEPTGREGDTFEFAPDEQSRTWMFRWNCDGAPLTVLGDTSAVPSDELWNHESSPAVSIQSIRIESDDRGRLVLSGRVVFVHAPALNRAFEVRVDGAGATSPGTVTADGQLQALVQPLPTRPPAMRFTIALAVAFGKTRQSFDTGDVTVRTAFRGASLAVTDFPGAEFSDTIAAGRLPVAIRFTSATYSPSEAMVTFVSQRDRRRYEFRMQETEPGTYALRGDPSMARLIEDRLDIYIDSQSEAAGTITIVPETLRGRWYASSSQLEWHPVEELSDLGVPKPQPKDDSRPMLVAYGGKSLAIDPTAFSAVILKEPLLALTASKIKLLQATHDTYECIDPDAQSFPLGKMIRRGSQYEIPSNARGNVKMGKPVIFQSAAGVEQGLLWNPCSSQATPDSYEAIPTDAIDAAEGRKALLFFRGSYLPVSVRRVKSAEGESEHWAIELEQSIALPRWPQVEPFLPLLMRVDGTPPSRIVLSQFGEPETELDIRSDGIPVGAGVGYIFTRRTTGSAARANEWVGLPPSTDETDLVYCTWRGFLVRFDRDAAQVQFAGWFVAAGQSVYPSRAPFGAYRFSRRQEIAKGRIAASPESETDEWTWLDSTIPEADQKLILVRVKAAYPPGRSETDAALDMRERRVSTPMREYVLLPVWSPGQKALVINVSEAPSAARSDAVALFAEKIS